MPRESAQVTRLSKTFSGFAVYARSTSSSPAWRGSSKSSTPRTRRADDRAEQGSGRRYAEVETIARGMLEGLLARNVYGFQGAKLHGAESNGMGREPLAAAGSGSE